MNTSAIPKSPSSFNLNGYAWPKPTLSKQETEQARIKAAQEIMRQAGRNTSPDKMDRALRFRLMAQWEGTSK